MNKNTRTLFDLPKNKRVAFGQQDKRKKNRILLRNHTKESQHSLIDSSNE